MNKIETLIEIQACRITAREMGKNDQIMNTNIYDLCKFLTDRADKLQKELDESEK